MSLLLYKDSSTLALRTQVHLPNKGQSQWHRRSKFDEHLPPNKVAALRHTQAKADLNMFTLTQNLYSGNLATPRQPAQLAGLHLFNSYDIFSTGVEVLAKKVNKFNQVHMRGPRLVATSYPPLDIEDLAIFADIQDFINAIRDGLDNVEELDLTSDIPPAG